MLGGCKRLPRGDLVVAALAILSGSVPAARGATSDEVVSVQWLVAAETGVFLGSRSLGYTGSSPGPTPLLRGYDGLVAGPSLFAEFYPVSPLTDDSLLAGIGLFARYAFSLGHQTTAGSRQYPSTFFGLDAGIKWRIRPFPSSRFVLVPAVSYQRRRFAVTPSFPGLPDANLSGVAGSVRTELPVGEIITLLLGGGFSWWLRARDLIGDGFFPAGDAYALEAEAGAGLRIYGPLSVRVLGFFDTTRYSLQVVPRTGYRATAASDTQIGGHATLRAEF